MLEFEMEACSFKNNINTQIERVLEMYKFKKYFIVIFLVVAVAIFGFSTVAITTDTYTEYFVDHIEIKPTCRIIIRITGSVPTDGALFFNAISAYFHTT